MEIGTAEISRIIKEQIRDYEKTVEIQEVGTVLAQLDKMKERVERGY